MHCEFTDLVSNKNKHKKCRWRCTCQSCLNDTAMYWQKQIKSEGWIAVIWNAHFDVKFSTEQRTLLIQRWFQILNRYKDRLRYKGASGLVLYEIEWCKQRSRRMRLKLHRRGSSSRTVLLGRIVLLCRRDSSSLRFFAVLVLLCCYLILFIVADFAWGWGPLCDQASLEHGSWSKCTHGLRPPTLM